MPYRVTSWDVCLPGFERLRAETETLLPVPVSPDSDADSILAELVGELDACARPDSFDFDAAEKAVRQWFNGRVRPEFEAGPNPFNLEPEPEDSDMAESVTLFVYLDTTPLWDLIPEDGEPSV